MANLKKEVNNSINIKHLDDVNKVTPKIVKLATKSLKSGKTDPACEFSSDCIINAPDILFEQLYLKFSLSLYHALIFHMLFLFYLVFLIQVYLLLVFYN